MDKMKRYEDFKNESNDTDYLTKEELEKVKWTRYKIVVPTQEDKEELEKAFEHIHYSDIDTDNIAVNQLAHEYLTEERTGDPRTINNIIVDEELFNKLNEKGN
jgi:hypothetical protein